MIEEENNLNSDDLIDEDDDVLESRLQQLATEELNQITNPESSVPEDSQAAATTANESKPEASKATAAAAATL